MNLTRVRQAARAAGFVGVTGALIPVYVARDRLASAETRDAVRDRWLARWASALLRLFAVRVELLGPRPPAPVGRGRLVVCNHRSAIDVVVLLGTLGGRMVSRADLSGWPVVGAAARSVGTVFVDRSDATSGAAAIREVRSLLRGGQTVIVFPEGTTFAGDEVRPFQAGAFLSAVSSDAEILPVGLAYEAGSDAAYFNETFPAHLARLAAAPRPTRVRMALGAPIPTRAPHAKSARAAALAEAAHAAVELQVARARRSFDP
jgi:lyso-ornithine lipid O-acyltransferase